MALHLATRPELPPEGGGRRERCGYPLLPGPAPTWFSFPGGARLRVLEGPAGLRVGYVLEEAPGERFELLRLSRPVLPCQAGPTVRFYPKGPFRVYAGGHTTGQGLDVWPTRDGHRKTAYLLLGPAILLVLCTSEPFPRI